MFYVGNISKRGHFASAISSDTEILIKPFKFTNNYDGFCYKYFLILTFTFCFVASASSFWWICMIVIILFLVLNSFYHPSLSFIMAIVRSMPVLMSYFMLQPNLLILCPSSLAFVAVLYPAFSTSSGISKITSTLHDPAMI